MKILVAPDKFKGSLTAREAGLAMREGLLRVWPDADVDVLPVADGGDGTAQALLDALGGDWVDVHVHGPDAAPLTAQYARLADGLRAVVELAKASGLALVPENSNDPRTATTQGTGELIAAALDAGPRRILLAIGGSATNDGGTGALSALGARFLDENGAPLPRGGVALSRLARIETTALEDRMRGVSIEIISDVENPLCGPNGASAIYGPQKGATPPVVRELDGALSHFADVVAKMTGHDMRDIPGAGAAGGIGFGFLALAGARIVGGAAFVLDAIGFPKKVEGASLVVTGEGKLDRQTMNGKAPFAVAQAAKQRGIPVVAIAGSVDLRGGDLERIGLRAAEPIEGAGMTLEDAMKRAPELVADAAERVGREIALGSTVDR